jgi:hypothetical protein
VRAAVNPAESHLGVCLRASEFEPEVSVEDPDVICALPELAVSAAYPAASFPGWDALQRALGLRLRRRADLDVRRLEQGGCSAVAVDGDFKCCADLAHPVAAEGAKALDEHTDRHAFHRVEVHRCGPGDRVLARLQDDLARQVPDRCGARADEGSTQSGDSGVPGQDDHGAPAHVGELTPPEFSATRWATHVAPAASLNDARSPQSSAWSIGWSS